MRYIGSYMWAVLGRKKDAPKSQWTLNPDEQAYRRTLIEGVSDHDPSVVDIWIPKQPTGGITGAWMNLRKAVHL